MIQATDVAFSMIELPVRAGTSIYRYRYEIPFQTHFESQVLYQNTLYVIASNREPPVRRSS